MEDKIVLCNNRYKKEIHAISWKQFLISFFLYNYVFVEDWSNRKNSVVVFFEFDTIVLIKFYMSLKLERIQTEKSLINYVLGFYGEFLTRF